MDFLTPLLIGIGLSMDCFAVSLAIGTTTKVRLIRAAGIIAIFFGGFQAGMTVIGWFAGISVFGIISGYGHGIAFLFLAVIGIKMVREGLSCEEEDTPVEVMRIGSVVILSVATSIDALAAGVSFGVLQTDIVYPALIIGIVAFSFSFAGVMTGKRLEEICGRKMEVVGGVVLLLIGLRILISPMVG